jgi:regulator of sigma E protease
MNVLQTILAFVVVIGVLVVIHELGHFLVARWCGVKVLRFSVGMGKVIWSRRFGRDQTEWAISVLPLGGYVKMLDVRDTEQGEIAPQDLSREFTRQPVGKRIAIVIAGPLANFLLAIALLAGLYIHGIPEPVARIAVAERGLAQAAGLRTGDLVTSVNNEPVRSYVELRWRLVQLAVQHQPATLGVQRAEASGARSLHETVLPLQSLPDRDIDSELFSRLGLELAPARPLLGDIVDGGPASSAGLRRGDLVLKVDGRPVGDAAAFIEVLQSAPGREVLVEGWRDGQSFAARVTPRAERVGDRTVGRIQAQVDLSTSTVVVQNGPQEALVRAMRKTWETSTLTLTMLGKMIIGEASLKNITGPITIADYAGQSARIGLISFLSFMAFISISLGVMNLLPIPVLDGGHLLYYALELFSGRPVPERIGMVAQRAGMGVLMALMAVAVFNDILRLIS